MIGHEAILKMGNPLLREVSKPLLKKEILSKDTKELIKKMWNIMAEAGGIGLALSLIHI